MKSRNFLGVRAVGDKPAARTLSAYNLLKGIPAITFLVIVGAVFFVILVQSGPQLPHILTVLFGKVWDPNTNVFGGLPIIIGTLETSFIALFLAVFFGLGASLAIRFLLTERLRQVAIAVLSLLAGVPSIVYGLWTFLVIGPWMLQNIYPSLESWPLASVLFGAKFQVVSTTILLASLVLAVMIVPTFVSVFSSSLALFPNDSIEAGQALGATKWQIIRRVVLPTLRGSFLGATSLSFARAIGETVAIRFVIGETTNFQFHLLSSGSTIASYIATQYFDATGDEDYALFLLALILMLITVAFSLVSNRLLENEKKLLGVK